jgi:hypothetical protein
VFESLERSVQAGPEFRKFYHQNNMQLESITSAKLYFHSQKSKLINHVKLTAPVILDRINPKPIRPVEWNYSLVSEEHQSR